MKHRRVAAAVLVFALSLGGSTFGAYALALHALDNSERAWCPVLHLAMAQAPAPKHPSAEDLRGRATVLELETRFGCVRK